MFERAIFNWVLEEIWCVWNYFGCSLFRYVIVPENLPHFLDQLDSKRIFLLSVFQTWYVSWCREAA